MSLKGETKVVVIGAGPAGMTASIYLAQAEIDHLVVEARAPGGAILRAAEVINYPGLGKRRGYEIALEIHKHMKELGNDVLSGEVVSVDRTEKGFIVDIKGRGTVETEFVIVATGAKSKTTGVLNEMRYFGKGVSYCAVCDGYLFKGKVMTVLGQDEEAFDSVKYLSSLASRLNWLVFEVTDEVKKTVNSLKERGFDVGVMKIDKVEDFKGEGKLEKLLVNVDGEVKEIMTDACFVNIGKVAATEFLNFDVHKDAAGFLIVDEDRETSVDGLYAAGDCVKKSVYQVATAVGDGAVAAVNVARRLV